MESNRDLILHPLFILELLLNPSLPFVITDVDPRMRKALNLLGKDVIRVGKSASDMTKLTMTLY